MESSAIYNQFKSDVEEFQTWIRSQPELPKNIKNLLLLRYLKVCNFDQENARKLLMVNLKMRQKNPHLFFDRDFMSEKLQIVVKTVQICPLPFYTNQNHKVTIIRLTDDNPHNFDVNDSVKYSFMMDDARFVTPDPIGFTEGEIVIMDSKGFSFRHLLKVPGNLSSVRTYKKYNQEAVPFKIHKIHFVNCSSILTKLMSMIRPFLNKELVDLMHFHTDGYDSLYEHVPKEILPKIYGGDFGDIDDLFKDWIKIPEKLQAYLNDESNWKLLL